MKNIDWIALDWGTSNLRLWGMSASGKMIAEKRSSQGMSGLQPHEFEEVFLSKITEWLGESTMPVIACGMVGAKQGWHETPYAKTPTVPATEFVSVAVSDPRIDLRIISGVCQHEPANVMRGEETQIAGILAAEPNFDGIICLPGSHSKWVQVQNGAIQHFQTAITGELFELIIHQSVLRHNKGEWSDEAFLASAIHTTNAPETALTRLFSVRADHLLHPNRNNGIAMVSGVLIGAELAGMRKYWQDAHLTIVGANELARLYKLVLDTEGVHSRTGRGSTLSLAGLTHAYRKWF